MHSSAIHSAFGCREGRGDASKLSQCPMSNVQCPMPNAQCPMPTSNAQSPTPNIRCPMGHGLPHLAAVAAYQTGKRANGLAARSWESGAGSWPFLARR